MNEDKDKLVRDLRELAGLIDPLGVGGRDAALLTAAATALEAANKRIAVLEEALAAEANHALTVEMLTVRLRRLIPQPSECGSYIGDVFYPVGGTEASHRWDGERWAWLPSLTLHDAALQGDPTNVAG